MMLRGRHVAVANHCEHFMANENIPVIQTDATVESTQEHVEEEFETVAEFHRMAAMHFSAAAKQHQLAGKAEEEGDTESTARHAFQAFRHQLNGVQYAEIAVMDSESVEDVIDSAED